MPPTDEPDAKTGEGQQDEGARSAANEAGRQMDQSQLAKTAPERFGPQSSIQAGDGQWEANRKARNDAEFRAVALKFAIETPNAEPHADAVVPRAKAYETYLRGPAVEAQSA